MSALTDRAGAMLDTLVEAQRGMSDFEAYRFMTTGELPDLSQPPEDPIADAAATADRAADAQVIPLDIVERALAGDSVALTASALLSDGALHGERWNSEVISQLWASVELTAAAGKWKPQDHPRDRNGRFIEKGAVSGLLSARKPVLADLQNAVAELDQKQWNNLTGAQQAHIAERVEKIPESTELGQQLRQKLGSLGAPKTAAPTAGPTATTSAPTGKKVVPAIIYKKHADGAVVAQRGSRRLRWDADTKKFAADERENGEWVEKQQLTKTAAYAEMKDGDWREPSAPVDNVPPAAVEPTPIDIVTTPVTPKPSPSTTQTDALTRYVNSSYARRADGAWVEVNEKTGKITNVDSSTSKALDANVKSGLMVPESPSASKLTVEPPPVRPDGVPLPDTNRFKKLTDQDAVNIHAQMQAPKWTAAQAQALNFYASDGHKTMNPALRGDVVPDGKTKKAIADARAGMRPLPRDVLVFRGTTYAQFGATGDNDMRKKIGEVFHDPAFISTSTSPYQDFVKNAPLRIEIEVPKGTPAAYVAAVSNNPSERELLLAPDQYLQLLDVRDTSLGTVSVLRVVPKPSDGAPSPAVGKPGEITKIAPDDAPDSGQTGTNLPAPASSETPEPASTGSQPTAKIEQLRAVPTGLSPQEADELADTLDEIRFAANEALSHAEVDATVTDKAGKGKVLTKQDIAAQSNAWQALTLLRATATSAARKALDLLVKRDGEPWGSVDTDDERNRWSGTGGPSVVSTGKISADQVQKLRDSYVVKDKQTIAHNASLRSANPSSVAKSWRARMNRMVSSATLVSDAQVFRGAAFSPELIASLRPGKIIIDPGIMSTDESVATAESYAQTRMDRLPGTLKTMFTIRAPKGTPAVDVGYGEYVFGSGTRMRIVSIERVGDRVDIITEMLPPEKVK